MNDSPLKTSGNGYSVLCSRWPYAKSCIQKINKGMIKGVVQSSPTCTDVDAPDDDEDDEGAIAVVDETRVYFTQISQYAQHQVLRTLPNRSRRLILGRVAKIKAV
jgi:hypothetical protein